MREVKQRSKERRQSSVRGVSGGEARNDTNVRAELGDGGTRAGTGAGACSGKVGEKPGGQTGVGDAEGAVVLGGSAHEEGRIAKRATVNSVVNHEDGVVVACNIK